MTFQQTRQSQQHQHLPWEDPLRYATAITSSAHNLDANQRYQLLVTMTVTPTTTSKPTVGLLADTDPTETVVVSIQPSSSQSNRSGGGRISQTTEHLLIAAGSIGTPATVPAFWFILTRHRRNHHHCHDCAGCLHHAEARSVFQRHLEATQRPESTWWLIGVGQHLRLGQQAKTRRRLQFNEKGAGLSSTCCRTHSIGFFLFAIHPAGP